MYEYSSVRSSSYDLEGLIASLNAKDTEGWEVVSVVPAGGELAAILRRSSHNGSRAGYETETVNSGGAVVAPEASAATTEAVSEPQDSPPTQDGPGWGAVAEPATASSNPWAESAATTTQEPAPTPAASA